MNDKDLTNKEPTEDPIDPIKKLAEIFQSRLTAAGLSLSDTLEEHDEKRWKDFCQISQDASNHFILWGKDSDDYLQEKQWKTFCELVASTKTITTLEIRQYWLSRDINQWKDFCSALEKNVSLKKLILNECRLDDLLEEKILPELWDIFWVACRKNQSLRTLELPMNCLADAFCIRRKWSYFCKMLQTQCTLPILDLREDFYKQLYSTKPWKEFVEALSQNSWIQKVILDPRDLELPQQNDINTLNTEKAITRHRVALTLGHCLQISRNLPMPLVRYILTYLDSRSLSIQATKELEAHAKNLSSKQSKPKSKPEKKDPKKNDPKPNLPKRKPWR